MSLRDFLNWFSGFSENIDGAPNEKQWGRITAKIAELQASGHEPEVHAAVSAALSEPVGGAGTTEWWKKQVALALEEEGYDPESAREALSTIPVDLNADPAAVARRAAQGM